MAVEPRTYRTGGAVAARGRGARRVAGRILLPLAGLVVIGLIWNAVILVFDLQPFVLPTPQAAIRAIGTNWSTLAPLTGQTVLETAYGFVIGAALGFVLAVVMSASRLAQRVIFPTLVTSQAVPIVAIAAPLVILFGFGMLPKLIIVAWIVFFPVAVNVLDGLAHVDPDLIRLSRATGAGPVREFAYIRLPATLSPLFTGLKIGATYAVTGAVIGEWTGTLTPGLGTHLLKVNASFKTDVVYGITFLLTAIGVISFLLVMLVEALATPWTRRPAARRPYRLDPGGHDAARGAAAVPDPTGEAAVAPPPITPHSRGPSPAAGRIKQEENPRW
jgi:ABC-type nitrate/sulfonate/bicarbonate transport system permease component